MYICIHIYIYICIYISIYIYIYIYIPRIKVLYRFEIAPGKRHRPSARERAREVMVMILDASQYVLR